MQLTHTYNIKQQRFASMFLKSAKIRILVLSFIGFIIIVKLNTTDTSVKQIQDYFYTYRKTNDSTESNLSIDNVLLTVRTSKDTQQHRMPGILKTWFQFSPNNTFIITNGNLTFLQEQLPQHFHQQIYSNNCSQAHSIRDLCCQSGNEFNIYFRNMNQYKWLCRFDDDQYVNVPRLIKYLGQFQSDEQMLYIGKPSLRYPYRAHGVTFQFGTYGGGVCFSRNLLKIIRNKVTPGNTFMNGCVASRLHDDVFTAYLIYNFNVNLTIAKDFHHHYQVNLYTTLTNLSTIDEAITLGFKGSNIPHFMPIFQPDIFHMQTLHCLLYPNNKCMYNIRVLLNRLYRR